MLTTNVDVADGLTNGAMGTITGVILKNNRISCILVHFDSETVGCSAK